MTKIVRTAALCILLATAMSASAALAQYVFYFKTYGDWSVVCARDSEGRRSCRLSAPPPVMGAGNPRSEIDVVDSGGASVRVRVQQPIQPGTPIYLRVDDKPAFEAKSSRFGEAVWSGADATAVIKGMESGQRMVLRSFLLGSKRPRDEIYSLGGFSQALQDYRSRESAYRAGAK